MSEHSKKSYASPRSVIAAVRDGFRLVRGARGQKARMPEEVKKGFAHGRDMCDMVRERTGVEIVNQRVLEIGAGQLAGQLAYMAAKNEGVGIDLDVYANGLHIGQYLAVLKRNGPMRFLKTVVRKAIGVDRAFWDETVRQMGLKGAPKVERHQMDVCRMSFPDNSFDFVYSFDVFEHLPDPAAAIKEIRRVLKPGGVMYHIFLPITAEDAIHDLRIIAGEREGIPYWAHLRPQHQHEVQASSYLNRLNIAEWRAIFASAVPGADVIVRQFGAGGRGGEVGTGERLLKELAAVRAAGELREFSDEDLLLQRMIVIWRKPMG